MGEQLRVRLSHADDFNFWTVPRFPEKPVHMPVNQSNNADAKRRMRGGGLSEQNARRHE
jgi:hypothetical protein